MYRFICNNSDRHPILPICMRISAGSTSSGWGNRMPFPAETRTMSCLSIDRRKAAETHPSPFSCGTAPHGIQRSVPEHLRALSIGNNHSSHRFSEHFLRNKNRQPFSVTLNSCPQALHAGSSVFLPPFPLSFASNPACPFPNLSICFVWQRSTSSVRERSSRISTPARNRLVTSYRPSAVPMSVHTGLIPFHTRCVSCVPGTHRSAEM